MYLYGGIDLYLYGRNGRKYALRAALLIARAAIKTPIVDGSIKNTWNAIWQSL